MKRVLITSTLLFLMINVTGCNTDQDNVTEVPENAPVEDNSDTELEQVDEVTFNFTHFDLDVDYGENQEYDVEYENEPDGMEAEIKDERNNIHLRGDDAFAELNRLFQQLTFDKDTPDEEVISEVINVFNINEDYEKFELEVTFLDGVEKEYKR